MLRTSTTTSGFFQKSTYSISRPVTSSTLQTRGSFQNHSLCSGFSDEKRKTNILLYPPLPTVKFLHFPSKWKYLHTWNKGLLTVVKPSFLKKDKEFQWQWTTIYYFFCFLLSLNASFPLSLTSLCFVLGCQSEMGESIITNIRNGKYKHNGLLLQTSYLSGWRERKETYVCKPLTVIQTKVYRGNQWR